MERSVTDSEAIFDHPSRRKVRSIVSLTDTFVISKLAYHSMIFFEKVELDSLFAESMNPPPQDIDHLRV